MILFGGICCSGFFGTATFAEETASVEYEVIEEGVEKKIAPKKVYEEVKYKFTPTVTGIYCFSAITGTKVGGTIYDCNMSSICSGNLVRKYDTYSYEGLFCLECKLEAGKTYYLGSLCADSDLKEYSVIIKKFEKADSVVINSLGNGEIKIG